MSTPAPSAGSNETALLVNFEVDGRRSFRILPATVAALELKPAGQAKGNTTDRPASSRGGAILASSGPGIVVETTDIIEVQVCIKRALCKRLAFWVTQTDLVALNVGEGVMDTTGPLVLKDLCNQRPLFGTQLREESVVFLLRGWRLRMPYPLVESSGRNRIGDVHQAIDEFTVKTVTHLCVSMLSRYPGMFVGNVHTLVPKRLSDKACGSSCN